ncbi:putative glycolipid-binding domain-containing protein [Pseudomonas schmalbachii]|uniref:Glycolipid-binding domain-containing protein n=1 Tax=Pseudomonas schmalbachii TaxID=2816993 RepID=A0ABS3TP14_9PSED|nr:putative glycolipid-binding domain-containing protein [Pseudomonas schmalbachii]MBO3275403.1 putative glycolipid-binding domain-containing protein [Pseudomonas schmalbachii]
MSDELNWIGIWQKPSASWETLCMQEGRADSQLRAIGEDGQAPYQLEYSLRWDAEWHLREALLRVESESASDELHLLADGLGHWQTADGTVLAELDGCLDIDIWPTPFTNTFPIRRLNLEDGQHAELDVVFLEAPRLKPRRMRQGYTRRDASHYLYQNLEGSGFQAVLEVDEQGLVIDYQGLFQRVAG